MVAKAPRRLRRRNTDEAVAKAIRDNFLGWEGAATDQHLVGGVSLRQQIKIDKKRQQNKEVDAPVMGKRYYEEVREKFLASSSPLKRLKVLNSKEELHPELEKALVGLNLHNRKFEQIMDFVERGPELNQLSLVCLYKHALKVNPSSSSECTNFCIGLLGYISRHSLDRKFPEEWELVKTNLDEGLCKSWKTFKSAGLPAKVWWAGVHQAASLIMPSSETHKLMNLPVDADWASLQTELATVVQGSQIGMRLFGAAWSKLLQGKVSKLVEATIEDLQQKDITKTSLAKNRENFLNDVRASGKEPMEAFAPRTVDVRYRGAVVPIKITSIYDEYLMAAAGVVHGLAVDKGVLTPMFCEQDLVDQHRKPWAFTVAPEVVQGSQAARAAATEMLRGKVHSAETLQNFFDTHSSVCLQLDRGFRLEIAFFQSVSGSGAERRLQEEILLCLPTAKNDITAQASLRALDKLESSKLMQFCGLGLQATFRSVRALVSGIVHNSPPNISGDSLTPFMKNILAAAGRFCTYTRPQGSAQAGQQLRGSEAIQLHFKDNQAHASGSEDALSLADLQPLVTFGFLLSTKEQELAKGWADKVLKQDLDASATAAVARGAKGSGKSARRKTTADARAMVLASIQ